MWTCLYLSHIVVVIMIIISILGIIYSITQKKIKAYQVIVVFLFCVISMALVSGITAMQYINDANYSIKENEEKIITNYWTYNTEDMKKIEDENTEYTSLVDLKTGNIVYIKNIAISTGKDTADLSNAEEATKAYNEIDIQEEYPTSSEELVTLDSKEFIKASDKIYYVTYNYSSTNTETNTSEKGKVYYVVNNSNQIKTIVKTKITNEESEKEFEERVLEIISSMNI